MKTSGTEQRTRIRIHTTMPTLFLTKAPKINDRERQLLQQMLLGKMVTHLQKTETRSMFITLY
jgi:hypothetical protein